ncbi:hypothetical protein LXL04_039094 [Taraxacum kok-saghyz]
MVNDMFIYSPRPCEDHDAEDEDVDTILPDGEKPDHEEDEEVISALLSNYGVANGYDLCFQKNNKDRAFELGSIVTYTWIGEHFVTDILESPKMSLRKMKAHVSKNFNVNVSLGQCRNAKRLVMTEIEEKLKDHYSKLWDFGAEIRRANPGSKVHINVEPQNDSTKIIKLVIARVMKLKPNLVEMNFEDHRISVDGLVLSEPWSVLIQIKVAEVIKHNKILLSDIYVLSPDNIRILRQRVQNQRRNTNAQKKVVCDSLTWWEAVRNQPVAFHNFMVENSKK